LKEPSNQFSLALKKGEVVALNSNGKQTGGQAGVPWWLDIIIDLISNMEKENQRP